MSRPLLLGHRGARATRSIPENTLASFDLALRHGCDGFEFDVRLTADGRALICHDARIQNLEIAQAGANDLVDFPILENVLSRYHDRAFLDIEIKVPGLEPPVLDLLKAYPPAHSYVVSSFLPNVLTTLHQLDPHLPLGLICETATQLAAWETLPIEVVLPHYTLTDIDLCRRVHGVGKKLFTWTVNRHDRMLDFQNMGVDGIISDNTEVLGTLRG